MSEGVSVQVNFSKPIGLFPLEGVTLFPHQVLPLHIFEPRYRQMIGHALDGSGQLAMAVFAGKGWKQNYHGRPRVRKAACLAQIMQHESLEDGRINVLIQGICRARIVRELPAAEDVLYRQAILEPIGLESIGPESAAAADAEHDPLSHMRPRLDALLSEGPLTHLTVAESVLEYLRNEEIPMHAVLEVLSFSVLGEHSTAAETRYELLAEGNPNTRATIIEEQLVSLQGLIQRGLTQGSDQWPKGVSWN